MEISNIAGKVTVRGWDRSDVALTGSMADGLTIKQDKSSNRVRWEVEYPRGRSNGGATLELRVCFRGWERLSSHGRQLVSFLAEQ